MKIYKIQDEYVKYLRTNVLDLQISKSVYNRVCRKTSTSTNLWLTEPH